jgi:hypothetical protein
MLLSDPRTLIGAAPDYYAQNCSGVMICAFPATGLKIQLAMSIWLSSFGKTVPLASDGKNLFPRAEDNLKRAFRCFIVQSG